MTLVTGGLGGLGLICSYHCATQFGVPVISTSRSGRPSAPGPQTDALLEALNDQVVHYSVVCDAGNACELQDCMNMLARSCLPMHESQLKIDPLCSNIYRHMNSLTEEQSSQIQDLLEGIRGYLYDIMSELRSKENTKIDPEAMRELQESEDKVSTLISVLAGKSGVRSGARTGAWKVDKKERWNQIMGAMKALGGHPPH